MATPVRILLFTLFTATVSCDAVTGLDDFAVGDGGGGNATGGAGGEGGTPGTGAGGEAAIAPANCGEIKSSSADAADGFYVIDPDGAGGAPAFSARCDMTTDGGGWTRFHWMRTALPPDTDPLGDVLHLCDQDADACLGRIPAALMPTALLVKDDSQNEHAAWMFDGGVISNAVFAALRDKQQSCLIDELAWPPYLDTSSESYCGTGSEGGCDSFMYDEGCVGLPGWSLQLDGDLWYAASAFKLGWMRNGNNCAQDPMWDYGYLNTMACTDEHGSLYFR